MNVDLIDRFSTRRGISKLVELILYLSYIYQKNNILIYFFDKYNLKIEVEKMKPSQ